MPQLPAWINGISALEWNLLLVLLLTALFCFLFWIANRQSTKSMKVALVILFGVPLLIYAIGSMAYETESLVPAVRAAFDCVVVLLPASLFFLFIATRRESLFNTYATNLDRLGLLRKRQLRIANTQAVHYPVENWLRLTRRVRSYLDRFGAVYGTLSPDKVTRFLESLKESVDDETAIADPTTDDSFSSFEVKTVLPVFGASLLIALGWLMVLPPYPHVPPSDIMSAISKKYDEHVWYLWAAEPVLLPVSFAFLGAYFFALQMIVKRFMRRDLGPNAYNAVSMRIILATLAVWVADQCFDLAGDTRISQGTLFALSFAIGVFPLIVWQLVANVLKRIPGVKFALPNLEGTAPLSAIDGLSVWHEARLEEEDIENVPNLATADIVDLMLNTKIAPNRIIDWVDQAIFLMTVPPPPDKPREGSLRSLLAEHGIRTASGLVAMTRAQNGFPDSVIDSFSESAKSQAISIAAAIQLCPNYPLVQNWLSTEPYFPPDNQQRGFTPSIGVLTPAWIPSRNADGGEQKGTVTPPPIRSVSPAAAESSEHPHPESETPALTDAK
jgi:hypothetical protein